MKKKLTKLEFYKKAKTHFSKKENRFDCPSNIRVNYPVGICKFLSLAESEGQISERTADSIRSKVIDVVDAVQEKNGGHFEYLYFPTAKDRISFINAQIKSLTKE